MWADIGAARPNVAKATAYVQKHLAESAAFVAYLDGKPIGTGAVEVQRWWYSDAPFGQDAWLFVLPEHRGSRAGAMLLDAMERVCTEAGAPFLLAVVNDKDLDRKEALFRRRGYRPMGRLYWRA